MDNGFSGVFTNFISVWERVTEENQTARHGGAETSIITTEVERPGALKPAAPAQDDGTYYLCGDADACRRIIDSFVEIAELLAGIARMCPALRRSLRSLVRESRQNLQRLEAEYYGLTRGDCIIQSRMPYIISAQPALREAYRLCAECGAVCLEAAGRSANLSFSETLKHTAESLRRCAKNVKKLTAQRI